MTLLLILACGGTVPPETPSPAPLEAVEVPTAPAVFAHRGASGYRPDHTLGAYRLAVEQGVDWVEPDLVMTADGHLIARHDLDLGPTTDVAEHFSDRRATRPVEGKETTHFFADDFTLAEVRTLRARQPRAERPHTHDGVEGVSTWPEILAFATEAGVGLVPELKHPTYLRSRGLDPVAPFLAAVRASSVAEPELWVQCFEIGTLRELRATSQLRLVQLVGGLDERPADGGPTYGHMLTPEGLAEVATYAHAVGVWKHHLLPLDDQGRYRAATSVVADAHAAGLEVHVYTFRDESDARPAEDASPADELRRYRALGVDAVFADHPDTALAAFAGSAG